MLKCLFFLRIFVLPPEKHASTQLNLAEKRARASEKLLGISMLRVVEHIFCLTHFHHFAGAHDHHPVAEAIDHNLKSVVEQVVSRHEPLKVTRRAGEAFVVMSAEDWEREQDTLQVLQNQSLMLQIASSLETHNRSEGYIPTEEQMNEITGI